LQRVSAVVRDGERELDRVPGVENIVALARVDVDLVGRVREEPSGAGGVAAGQQGEEQDEEDAEKAGAGAGMEARHKVPSLQRMREDVRERVGWAAGLLPTVFLWQGWVSKVLHHCTTVTAVMP